jgi:hypothetical protein
MPEFAVVDKVDAGLALARDDVRDRGVNPAQYVMPG